jgi:hypothetical protein
MWIHENGRQYLFLAAEFIPILVAELTVERKYHKYPKAPHSEGSTQECLKSIINNITIKKTLAG